MLRVYFKPLKFKRSSKKNTTRFLCKSVYICIILCCEVEFQTSNQFLLKHCFCMQKRRILQITNFQSLQTFHQTFNKNLLRKIVQNKLRKSERVQFQAKLSLRMIAQSAIFSQKHEAQRNQKFCAIFRKNCPKVLRMETLRPTNKLYGWSTQIEYMEYLD